eukprot:sb/3469029/
MMIRRLRSSSKRKHAAPPIHMPGAALPPEDLSKLDYRGKRLYEVSVDAMGQLRETVFWPDGWTTESEKEGVKVFSRAQRKMPNKIFLSESNFFCSLEDLYDVLYRQISGAVSWNKGIIENLNPITTLIQHTFLREFLTLRYWAKERDMFFIVNRDIDDPVKPVSKSYVRGCNGPCGYVFFPDLDGSVKLTYVVNCDLKLPFVPAKVINSSMVEVIQDFHLSLRKRIDEHLELKRRKNTVGS